MSLITCAGIDVLEAIICQPRLGAWTATLVLDAVGAPPGTLVTVSVADGLWTLKGTVRSGGDYIGTRRLRLVGGAGGLSVAAGAKYYQQAVLGDVLADLLALAGETRSTTIDQALLATSLRRWTTPAKPVASAIASLAKVAPSPGWRLLADGSVWLGSETWPTVDSSYDFDVVARRPQDHLVEIAAAYPFVQPGQQLVVQSTGEVLGNVSYAEHRVSADAVRTVVLVE